MSACLSFLSLIFLFSAFSLHGNTPDSLDANASALGNEIIRVIQPGVFDIQSQDFLIRMRAWGVEFPKRGQPGFDEALAFWRFNISVDTSITNVGSAVLKITDLEQKNGV